nr:MAG TPA: ReqiPepy6 protein [Caudoviricetes sp.]
MIWIWGDFLTGRRLGEIANPGGGSSWTEELHASSATLVLDPAERVHRLIGDQIRRRPGYRHYLGILDDDGRAQVAVSGLSMEASPGEWRIQGSGFEAYASVRQLMDETDTNNPVGRTHEWVGTWRQIVGRALTLVSSTPWGMPPVSVTVGELAGGGSHTITVEVQDLRTLGDLLNDINRRADGVECRFQAWWEGGWPDGHMRWELGVGQQDRPLIAGPERIVFDTSAPAPAFTVNRSRIVGDLATNSWVSGGRTDGQMIIRSWANRDLVWQQGYPQIDITDLSSNSADRVELDGRAHQMARNAKAVTIEVGLTVHMEAPQNPMYFHAGDWAELRADTEHDMLPAGRHATRIMRREWDASQPDVVTVTVRSAIADDRWV